MHDSPANRRRTLAVIFAAALAANLVTVIAGGLAKPPKNGDGLSYDAIACSLAAGSGYGSSWSDPQFRQPYIDYDRQHPDDPNYTELLARSSPFSLTAYRPPGIPLLLAGIYRTVGRNFAAWRLLNSLFTATAVLLVASLAWRLAGPGVGILAGIFSICDPTIKKFTGYFLAEGPTVLLIIVAAWLIVWIIHRRRVRDAAMLGVVFGLLILFRSIFVLWVPLMLIVVIWAWTRPLPDCQSVDGAQPVKRRPVILAAGAFVLMSLLMPSPWWIRNVIVLDAMMPMGTQGGIGLPGGFSDAAIANSGYWVDAESFGVFDELNQQLDARNATSLEREKAQAQYGTTWVLDWMKHHPGGILKLMGMKLWHLWTRSSIIHALVLAVLGLAGLRWMRHRPDAASLWAFIVCVSLVAMGTYVTRGGRFIVPALPILHILGAIGIWRLIEAGAAPRRNRPD